MNPKSSRLLLALAFAAAVPASVHAQATDPANHPVNPFRKHHVQPTNHPIRDAAPKTRAATVQTSIHAPAHTKPKTKRHGAGSHLLFKHNANTPAPAVK